MDRSQIDWNTEVRLSKVPGASYPKVNDIFQMVVVPPVPTDNVPTGHVIVRNLFLSVDATMRIWISGAKSYMDPVKPGDLMKGSGVGQVIYSKGNLKVGDIVLGMLNWQKYCLISEKQLTVLPKEYPYPEDFLGIYGISRLTAYFGLFDVGKIQEGETVVISAAAGAVGEIAVQLAKNHGCKVIGVAGGADKCEYVKKLGADHTIDYKKGSILPELRKLCPKGVDVYFDNVGGQMLDDVLMVVRDNCRVVLCGAISSYNENPAEAYRIKNYQRLIIKRGTMQGFLFFDYSKKYPEAIQALMKQVQSKKLTYRKDILVGLEEAPAGLQRLLTGKNEGKVLIKLVKNDAAEPKPKL